VILNYADNRLFDRNYPHRLLGVLLAGFANGSKGMSNRLARLEDLVRGVSVKGILPDCLVTVIDVKWHGNTVVELTYKDSTGRLGSQLLYRDNEPALEIAEKGLPWSFNADGRLFRLASEAKRISLAYLFDPYLSVHTSLVEPLPHQPGS
jgi:hypothetical protein